MVWHKFLTRILKLKSLFWVLLNNYVCHLFCKCKCFQIKKPFMVNYLDIKSVFLILNRYCDF